MPDRFVLPLVVRTFEADAHGQVLPATYLRWFQEAAIYASAANGFDEERYRALGTTWFVREFHLVVHSQPQTGETLEVITWAADIERITAHRQYSARRTNGDPIADAEAEWIYMDRATGKPRRLEREVIEAFPPQKEYALADREWGKDLLGADLPEADAHRMEHTVAWSELDGAQHVNNAVYAQWITDHIVAASAGGRNESDEGPGVIRRLRLEYRRGARGGESLVWRLARFPGTPRIWHHRSRIISSDEIVTQAVVEMA